MEDTQNVATLAPYIFQAKQFQLGLCQSIDLPKSQNSKKKLSSAKHATSPRNTEDNSVFPRLRPD